MVVKILSGGDQATNKHDEMFNERFDFMIALIKKYGDRDIFNKQKVDIKKDKRFGRVAATIESMALDGFGLEAIFVSLIEMFPEEFKIPNKRSNNGR